MSTSEISAEDVLTSKSVDMHSTEINMQEATEELKIVYSNINNGSEKFENIGFVNINEISLQIPFENDRTTDKSGIIKAENDYVQNNANVQNTAMTAGCDASNNEVDCVEVLESHPTATQIEENDAIKTPSLTESTFGLINQDQIIEQYIPVVENINNSLRELQNDMITPENKATESIQDKKVDEKCQTNIDKNLLTNQKSNATKAIQLKKTVNSLSCLATEYASSDSEEDEMIPSPCEIITIVDDHDYVTQDRTRYRTKPVDVDSTSEDTDSDSDESSTSNDSDSDSESEFEDGPENVTKAQPSKIKKTKNEFEDLPPIEELKITVAPELCDRFGEVSGIVEQLVIVRPITGKPTLNLDSILFLEKGHRVLGQVFDVFGQVADPHYCIRFNSEDHIKQSGIVVGMEVYYSPNTEHTSLVFLHELVKLKGIDVSGEDDVEPPEFSDDEEERAYNQLQRQKQRQKPGMTDSQDNTDTGRLPQKRQCPDRQRNPWSGDWQSQNYNHPRPNHSSGQGPPRWNPENFQPAFQNPFFDQSQRQPSNQPPPNQYGPANTFSTPRYQYNPYNNPYQQNNAFPPPNQRFAFGRPPGFRPTFNHYDSNSYRSNPYTTQPMSWQPPPPLPPPPPPPPFM